MNVLCCGLATPGLLFPQVTIAEALNAAGDHAQVVSTSTFAPLLRNAGIPVLPVPTAREAAFAVPQWALTDRLVEQAGVIGDFLTRAPYDVVVASHLNLGAIIASELHNVPVCLIGGCTPLYPRDLTSSPKKTFVFRENTRFLQAARKALGLREASWHPAESPLFGDALLLQTVPPLLPEITELPRVHAVGPLLWSSPENLPSHLDAAMERAAGKGYAIWYAQVGRIFIEESAQLWFRLLTLLGNRKVLLLVNAIRSGFHPSLFPPNVVVHQNAVQDEILSRSSVALCTGHPTAVLGALIRGVPLLLVPGGSGSMEIAEYCVSLGVGLAADPNMSDAELTGLFDAIQNDGFRARARDCANVLAQYDPRSEALAVIRSLSKPRAAGTAV